MADASATARAPGKVILLGEHFVVHGSPAIAVALDRGTEVTARLRPGPGVTLGACQGSAELSRRMIEAILVELGVEKEMGVEIDVRSEIPTAAGLGASAAFAVAASRALARLARGTGAVAASNPEIFRIALQAEKIAHGTPSGIDPFLATYGGLVCFEKGPPQLNERIAMAKELEIVIGLTAERGETSEMVARVRDLAKRHVVVFRNLVDAVGRLVAKGRHALGLGNTEGLGEVMNMSHGLLSAIGVSTGPLEGLVAAARAAGATGAKLTGAGGGGAMIALCPGRTGEVVQALRREGAKTVFTTRLRGSDL